MHHQSSSTLQSARTTISPEAVLEAATNFFTRQNAIYTAFPEMSGPGWATYRGQGGEEIAVAAMPAVDGVTLVSASTYMFDQQVARFLSSLPPAPPLPEPVAIEAGEVAPDPTRTSP